MAWQLLATLDMGNNPISNVADPSGPQDVATLNYVNAAVIAGTSAAVTSVGGGTNINITGTSKSPTVNVSTTPTFSGLVTAQTGLSVTSGVSTFSGAVSATTSLGATGRSQFTQTPGTSAIVPLAILGQSTSTVDLFEIFSGATKELWVDSSGVLHLNAPLPVAQGGTGTTSPALTSGTNTTVSGSWPAQAVNLVAAPTTLGTNITGLPLTTGVTGLLPIANGGTGTASPGDVQGTNISITGSWPTQTINLVNNPTLSGLLTTQAGITNSAGDITSTSTAGSAHGFTLNNGAITVNPAATGYGIFLNGGTLTVSAGPIIATGLNGQFTGPGTGITGLPLTTGVTGILPIANGGTNTASPSLTSGTNTTVSGSWPNQAVNLVAAPTTLGTNFTGIPNGALITNPLDRANHTGTQLASTISNLAATVQAYTLDQFAAPAADVAWATHKITGLGDPSGAQDAATKNYVDTNLQAAAAGIASKPSVRIVATSNINTATTGLTAIDGVTPIAGDRVLLTGQSTQSQNGVWIAASGAWARVASSDSSPNSELSLGSLWFVEEGTTGAGTQWVLNSPTTGAITPDTTSITIVKFSAGTPYTASLGVKLVGSDFEANLGTNLTLSGNAITISTSPTLDATNITGLPLTTGVTGILPIAHGGTNTASPSLTSGTNTTVSGSWPAQAVNLVAAPTTLGTNITGLPLTTGVTGILPIGNGGTGTGSPGNTAGSNITLGSSFPTQSIAVVNNPTFSGLLTTQAGITNSGGDITTTSASSSANGIILNTGALTINPASTAWGMFVNGGTVTVSAGPIIVTGTNGQFVGPGTGITGLPLTTGVTGLLPIANGGTNTATPNLAAGTNTTISGTWPAQSVNLVAAPTTLGTNITGLPLTTGVTGILPVANGGNATATPSFVSGTNTTVSGSWPAQAVNLVAAPTTLGTNITGLPLTTGVTGILPIANGGTGTGSPGNTAGSNISLGSSFPTQSIAVVNNPTFSGLLTSQAGHTNSGGDITTTSTAASANGIILNQGALTINPASTAWGAFINGGTLTVSAGPIIVTGTNGQFTGPGTGITGLPLTTGVTGILPLANGGNATATPSLVAGTNTTVSGSWPAQAVNLVAAPTTLGTNITGLPLTTGVTGVLGVSNGGTGTASPGNTAGTNISLGSSFPTQSIAVINNPTFSGLLTTQAGITNSAGDINVTTTAGSTHGIILNSGAITINPGATGYGLFINGGTLTVSAGPIVVEGTNGQFTGPGTGITGLPLTTGVTGILPIANGGTNTASPALVNGTGITLSGSWPNNTITYSGALSNQSDVTITSAADGQQLTYETSSSKWKNKTFMPPQVVQYIAKETATTTFTLTPSQTVSTAAGHILIAIIINLNSSAVTTPTGYASLGVQGLSGSSQINVYTRNTPTGNSSDNCAVTQANSTAMGGILIEFANGGTSAGFASGTHSSATSFNSSTLTASINDMIVAIHASSSTAPTYASTPSWKCHTFGTAAAGQLFMLHMQEATFATTYTSSVQYAGIQNGVSAIFRIPSNS